MPDASVTLDAPRLLVQHADLVARAVFSTPAGLSGAPENPLPADTTFRVRTPGGNALTYATTSPFVRAANGGVQLSIRATEYGDWHVRVEGTVLVNGQRVRVARETLTYVASSPFA